MLHINFGLHMRVLKIFAIIVTVFTLLACNATRVVKPIAAGEKQLGAGLGGALIKFVGVPMPLPLTNVYGAYGLNNKTTVFASLHTTALMFGVLQTDIGITQQVIKQKKIYTGY